MKKSARETEAGKYMERTNDDRAGPTHVRFLRFKKSRANIPKTRKRIQRKKQKIDR